MSKKYSQPGSSAVGQFILGHAPSAGSCINRYVRAPQRHPQDQAQKQFNPLKAKPMQIRARGLIEGVYELPRPKVLVWPARAHSDSGFNFARQLSTG